MAYNVPKFLAIESLLQQRIPRRRRRRRRGPASPWRSPGIHRRRYLRRGLAIDIFVIVVHASFHGSRGGRRRRRLWRATRNRWRRIRYEFFWKGNKKNIWMKKLIFISHTKKEVRIITSKQVKLDTHKKKVHFTWKWWFINLILNELFLYIFFYSLFFFAVVNIIL